MAQQNMTPEEQLLQLRDARKLVLSDVKYYPNIVQVVLPILAPTSGSTVRRWVADFIAEAFASPALPSKDKETLCLLVLEHLKQTLERPKEDPYVLKSIIMAAASIYPLAMRWMCVPAFSCQSRHNRSYVLPCLDMRPPWLWLAFLVIP